MTTNCQHTSGRVLESPTSAVVMRTLSLGLTVTTMILLMVASARMEKAESGCSSVLGWDLYKNFFKIVVLKK